MATSSWPPPPTWAEVVVLGLFIVVMGWVATKLYFDARGLEYENQVLRQELQTRATLVPPPGVLWTEADTLTCYPQRFDR